PWSRPVQKAGCGLRRARCDTGRLLRPVSTLQFKRTPRLAAPRPPGGEVHLEPPPEIPRTIPGHIVQKVLPGVMIVASLGMMGFMLQRGQSSPMMMTMRLMMLISTFGMRGGGGSEGSRAWAARSEDGWYYVQKQGQTRGLPREAAHRRRLAREWVHAEPRTLWTFSAGNGTRRMWARR